MRPHMAHIAETLERKAMAEDAKDIQSSYKKYRAIADRSLSEGYFPATVAAELAHEIVRIEEDVREGDQLYLNGVANAKTACIAAIRTVIAEIENRYDLKGEKHG